MGIAIHNATASNTGTESIDLASGIRQNGSGILGTTVQLGDLVKFSTNITSIIANDNLYTGDTVCCRGIPLHRGCCGTTEVRSRKLLTHSETESVTVCWLIVGVGSKRCVR